MIPLKLPAVKILEVAFRWILGTRRRRESRSPVSRFECLYFSESATPLEGGWTCDLLPLVPVRDKDSLLAQDLLHDVFEERPFAVVAERVLLDVGDVLRREKPHVSIFSERRPESVQLRAVRERPAIREAPQGKEEGTRTSDFEIRTIRIPGRVMVKAREGSSLSR